MLYCSICLWAHVVVSSNYFIKICVVIEPMAPLQWNICLWAMQLCLRSFHLKASGKSICCAFVVHYEPTLQRVLTVNHFLETKLLVCGCQKVQELWSRAKPSPFWVKQYLKYHTSCACLFVPLGLECVTVTGHGFYGQKQAVLVAKGRLERITIRARVCTLWGCVCNVSKGRCFYCIISSISQ